MRTVACKGASETVLSDQESVSGLTKRFSFPGTFPAGRIGRNPLPFPPSGPDRTVGPMARTLLLIVNDPGFLLSHRLPVALAARDAGFSVHIATTDGPALDTLRGHGFTPHIVPLSRKGKNPVQELILIIALWRLMRQIRPDVVHAVTIKPVLYGGIAARLAGVRRVVSAVSGLGSVFIAHGWRAAILRRAVKALYRLSLSHPGQSVIFQNPDDRDAFIAAGLISPQRCVLIRGSGVSLSAYPALPEPAGEPVVVFAARLLFDKGIAEFIEAATLLRRKGVCARFLVAGTPDPGNPASVSPEDLSRWTAEGAVTFLGHQADIAGLFGAAHIVVLPSYTSLR